MPRHPDFFRQLNEPLLEQLEEFVRAPGRKGDEIHAWLSEHGVQTSRSAVYRWKQGCDQDLMQERFSRSSELAMAIKSGVQNGQFGDVADAAVMQLVQVIFEQAVKLDSEGKVKSGDLLNMAMALRQTVGTKDQLIKQLAAKFDTESKKLQARRPITDDDIAAVRKAVFG